MDKVLFLQPFSLPMPKTRMQAFHLWNNGVVFCGGVVDGTSYEEVTSKRNINAVRDRYDRVVVVYCQGTIEV